VESYEVVRDPRRLEQVANEIHEASEVSLDLETVGFIPHRGKIRLCSVNTGKGVYVIDMFETKTLGPVVDALRSSNAVKIGQNLKFDQRWLLHHENLELHRIFDTYRASALIHNGRKHLGNNLYDLYERELGIGPGTADLGGSNWAGNLSQEHFDYAAEDVIHLPKLREKLKPQLAKWGLNQTALIEFEAILPEAALENSGFRLDAEPWMALYRENAILANKLQAELLAELPHPAGQLGLPGMTPSFNIGSTQQLQKSLARLGLDVDSTNEETLAMNAGKFPILKKLIDFKKVKKLCDAFGPDFLEHIDPQTGRIHARFFPFTGAGRYSCSDPNLQQIPRLKAFRGCFRPGPGRKLIVNDYSQIELRIAAEISGDATMLEAYKRGEDIHRLTAALVNQVDLSEVTKAMRQMAKAINFGLIYGLGAARLVIYAQTAYGVTMTEAQAQSFRKRYFEGYAGISSWHRKALNEGKAKKMARTLSGRLRWLEDEKAHNEFLNTPVQGTGADGLKRALRKVYDRLKKYGGKVFLTHMVHDEIVLDSVDDPEILAAAQLDLKEGMEEGIAPLLKKVPADSEGGTGDSWADK
jgi:DNA polymerase I-like protein with 3'-5' exonuclease and polymerase domains